MWIVEDDLKKFKHGLQDFMQAELAARECHGFAYDDDDELIDDNRSCFNCTFRRWSKETIYCMNNNL